MKKEFQGLDGGTGDVSDAFYQFSVENMAEWFGLDDAVYPHKIGLDGPNEQMFPCFAGIPQGWTCALYFCQSAVQWRVNTPLGPVVLSSTGVQPHMCMTARFAQSTSRTS